MERCDGGDLISLQQDLGSTLGFSQQHGTKSSASTQASSPCQSTHSTFTLLFMDDQKL